MKLSHIQSLDGLRGIAALMVMFFHFFQGNPLSGGSVANLAQRISGFGQTGVTLFFVLSGFLITRILINQKGKAGYFSTFYMRRSLRIFPLYYGFLCITYFALPLAQGYPIPDFSQQIYYWVYLQNVASTFNIASSGPGHFWSLAVEEHFYLFWPFLVYFLSTQRLEKVIYGIIVFSIGLRYLMFTEGFEVFYFTFTRFDSLAIGALMAVYEKKGLLAKFQPKHLYGGLVTVFAGTLVVWVATSGKSLPIVQVFKFTLLSVTYFFLLGIVIKLKPGSLLNTGFTCKPLLYTGKISYGLYVFHPMLYHLYFKYNGKLGLIPDLILCFLLSYAVSALSFHCFEAQVLRLKRFFEYPESLKTKST